MRGLQLCLMSLASLALAAVLGSCGKVAEGGDLQIDSNTNWLKRCESNAECSGALVCLCGQCTQPCAESSECGLLTGASCGSASGSACGDSPGAGGLCVLECTAASECADADFTCSDGQCVPLPRANGSGDDLDSAPVPGPSGLCPRENGFDMDDVLQTILLDLSSADDADRINYRYLSLANRWNAGLCEPDLQVERAGMIKALNSLSLGERVEQPVAIDAARVIYRIDLRDYEWDRPVTIAGANYTDAWEAITTLDPYSIPWAGDDADDVVNDTVTRYPVMFASAFVAVATDAPVYYALIEMSENVDAFILEELGIDRDANLAEEEALRAGFSGASFGLPNSAFVAERHDTEVRAGYLWTVAAFGGIVADLFAEPLGAPASDRELVFTLANGMLAFAFADAEGNRLDASGAFGASPLAIRDSFRRYASGVLVADEVRAAAAAGLLEGHVTVDEIDHVLAIYPDAAVLAQVLDEDRSLYLGALGRAGVDVNAAEPISSTFAAFTNDVDLSTAAGDLMLTPDRLERDLAVLDEEIQVLENGRVSRDAFTRFYARSLCTLSVALENVPDVSFCAAALSGP